MWKGRRELGSPSTSIGIAKNNAHDFSSHPSRFSLPLFSLHNLMSVPAARLVALAFQNVNNFGSTRVHMQATGKPWSMYPALEFKTIFEMGITFILGR
jgi:hypothetical protein